MSKITISAAKPDELPEAAELTSRAMINLPEVAVVFRGKRQRMEAVQRITYEKMPGQVFVAKDDSQIVGVMRVVEWPHCKLSPQENDKLLPSMKIALKDTLPRAMKFQQIWGRRDPKEHHWHLDPLAVLPESQGRGIGTQMMNYYCEYIDARDAAGYLETGTMDNVHFYERFGFSVIGEAPIFEVPTRLMWRSKR
jgi:predicted N-acetyltransferase YhbS